MKLTWMILLFAILSCSSFAYSGDYISDNQNHCLDISPEKGTFIDDIVKSSCYQKMMGEEVDCSVLRNYRDENGNWVCPTVDYDACLKKYGPRLPPSYFQFVKNWCYCNCIFDPDEK